jgi:phosphoribulokinase
LRVVSGSDRAVRGPADQDEEETNMSRKHPIVAVTGSSGAGTTSVKMVFEHIFRRESIRAVVIEGDSYHRYTREEMRRAIAEAEAEGRHISHFGPEANLFDELEAMFRQYGQNGTGRFRKYLHNDEEAAQYQRPSGTFSDWEPLAEGSELLFYEGLHGGVKTETCDVASQVDLLIGVVPIVNLEWIQKMHRDMKDRGYSVADVTQTILRRLPDYVNYILPQFGRTHINFQRVPTVDTSNPLMARDIPNAEESFVVIRFRDPHGIDFPYLLTMVHDSFMSRPNSIVVPGGKLPLAMQLILTPLILDLVETKRRAGSVTR